MCLVHYLCSIFLYFLFTDIFLNSTCKYLFQAIIKCACYKKLLRQTPSSKLSSHIWICFGKERGNLLVWVICNLSCSAIKPPSVYIFQLSITSSSPRLQLSQKCEINYSVSNLAPIPSLPTKFCALLWNGLSAHSTSDIWASHLEEA